MSLARGDIEQAPERFASAEKLALEMRMRPLVWQARAGAARALAASGRAGEVDEKLLQARAVIDEIAGMFEDDKLRSMYLESATRTIA